MLRRSPQTAQNSLEIVRPPTVPERDSRGEYLRDRHWILEPTPAEEAHKVVGHVELIDDETQQAGRQGEVTCRGTKLSSSCARCLSRKATNGCIRGAV